MDASEQSQFDILDGPFARFFHLFFKRRLLTPQVLKPYPWFIGGVHRAARMLDVADGWELLVIFFAPFLFFALFHMGWLHIPMGLQGYGLLVLGCYTGFFFVLWVFLDRRLDYIDQSRVLSVRKKRMESRDDRLLRRRMAKNAKPELVKRNVEAAERGKQKATALDSDEDMDHPPPPELTVPVRPVPVSLDELLRHD